MLSFTKSRHAGKTLLQTLFFFLLVTQICFAQWTQVGLNGKSIKDIAVQNSTIFAVTSDSGSVYRSVDNGANWTMIVDSNAVDVSISLSGRVFMVMDSTFNYYWGDCLLYYSLDNGNTWTWVNIIEQIQDSIPGEIRAPRNIAVGTEGNIFCYIKVASRITTSGQDLLAKSSDDGFTWITPGPGVIGGRLFDFRNQYSVTVGGKWVAYDGGHSFIYLSSDNGNTWTYLGLPAIPSSELYPSILGLFSNGNILAGGSMYDDSLGLPFTGILLSTDMCNTWTQISSLNSQVGLSWSNGSSEGMLVGTPDLGVFLFSDEGDSLDSRNEGLTNLNIQTITLDNNGYVYAGTGNGVWRRPLSEIVPVELTSFNATANEKEVILNWSTATETNNSGFSIERKSVNSDYSEIGFVPGFGTTIEPKTYSFTNSEVSTGKYTYRLKQIDFDGSYDYSAEIEVEVSALLEFSLEQNFPNPFNPNTTIKYSIPELSNVKLILFNLLSEEVTTLVNEEKITGKYSVEFDASTLPSGVYFYQLSAGNYISTKKMVLIK